MRTSWQPKKQHVLVERAKPAPWARVRVKVPLNMSSSFFDLCSTCPLDCFSLRDSRRGVRSMPATGTRDAPTEDRSYEGTETAITRCTNCPLATPDRQTNVVREFCFCNLGGLFRAKRFWFSGQIAVAETAVWKTQAMAS